MATNYETRNLEVPQGPGKWDLMLSLFEGKEVTFTLVGLGQQKMRIEKLGVSQYRGYPGDYTMWAFLPEAARKLLGCRIKIHLNSKTRKGWIAAELTADEAKNFDKWFEPFRKCSKCNRLLSRCECQLDDEEEENNPNDYEDVNPDEYGAIFGSG